MIRFIRSTHLQSHPDTVFWSGALNGVIVLILLFAFLAGYFFNAGANAYLMGGAFAGAALLLFLVSMANRIEPVLAIKIEPLFQGYDA